MQTRSGLVYPQSQISNQNYYIQLARDFRAWKEQVNSLCLQHLHMGCDDLVDHDYYSSFVENFTPQDMFNVITREFYYHMLD